MAVHGLQGRRRALRERLRQLSGSVVFVR